jgi:hypothetical protein
VSCAIGDKTLAVAFLSMAVSTLARAIRRLGGRTLWLLDNRATNGGPRENRVALFCVVKRRDLRGRLGVARRVVQVLWRRDGQKVGRRLKFEDVDQQQRSTPLSRAWDLAFREPPPPFARTSSWPIKRPCAGCTASPLSDRGERFRQPAPVLPGAHQRERPSYDLCHHRRVEHNGCFRHPAPSCTSSYLYASPFPIMRRMTPRPVAVQQWQRLNAPQAVCRGPTPANRTPYPDPSTSTMLDPATPRFPT